MTRNVIKILTVALLAGSIGQVALSVPAYAGGQISFNLAPDNAEDSGLFSTGLRVYSLFRGLKGADIRQLGRGMWLASLRRVAAILDSSSNTATVIPQPCGRMATTTPTVYFNMGAMLEPTWSRTGTTAAVLPLATAGNAVHQCKEVGRGRSYASPYSGQRGACVHRSAGR